jgi:hypothetical protein
LTPSRARETLRLDQARLDDRLLSGANATAVRSDLTAAKYPDESIDQPADPMAGVQRLTPGKRNQSVVCRQIFSVSADSPFGAFSFARDPAKLR